MTDSFDILICGGGIAGLTAACAFGTSGFSVLCIDPYAPVVDAHADGADMRSTAFLQPARTLLMHAGLWDRLAGFATPLEIMRLADAGGVENEIRHIADFDASEISDQPFGWNLPNWLLRREMMAKIEELDTVEFRAGVTATNFTPRSTEMRVMLSNGQNISVRQVVAADGRNSPTRDAMGIDVKTVRYGQKALAFVVRHPVPHQNISTELHRSGGPFTLVPLPDHQGQHYSSVVWMEKSAEAMRLANLPEEEFNQAASARSCCVLGPLSLTSPRNIFPIISQRAHRVIAPRTALIAEAAHVVPPIGAQGLNMSLNDIGWLVDAATDAPDKLGEPMILDAYQRARMPDILVRFTGVDLLNRAAIAEAQNLRALRLKGLQSLHGITPIRQAAMRIGLGV